MMFEEIKREELQELDGGANGWMIAIGGVGVVGGVIECVAGAPGPGAISIAAGTVLIIAGIVY